MGSSFLPLSSYAVSVHGKTRKGAGHGLNRQYHYQSVAGHAAGPGPQQVQLEVFKDALDMQKDQVAALMASASLQPQLANEGMVGTLINTYA